eukprot:1149425-Pelagomonas_calceolata.AAC.2
MDKRQKKLFDGDRSPHDLAMPCFLHATFCQFSAGALPGTPGSGKCIDWPACGGAKGKESLKNPTLNLQLRLDASQQDMFLLRNLQAEKAELMERVEASHSQGLTYASTPVAASSSNTQAPVASQQGEQPTTSSSDQV